MLWTNRYCLAKIFLFTKILPLYFAAATQLSDAQHNDVIFAEEGQNLLLQARLDDVWQKNVSIEWQVKDPKRIERIVTSDPNTVVSKIFIRNYSKTQDGVRFKCIFRNISDIIGMRSFEVMPIDEFIHFDHQIWNQTARPIEIYGMTGKNMRIMAKGFIQNYSVEWYWSTQSQGTLSPVALSRPSKYAVQNSGEISNLTIARLDPADSGYYTTFYFERNEWPIFRLEVLKTIQLSMNSTHYFHSASNESREIVCEMYGHTNASIRFSRQCELTKYSTCSGVEEVISNDFVRLVNISGRIGYSQAILDYPYDVSANIICGMPLSNPQVSVSSRVIIAPFAAPITLFQASKNNLSDGLEEIPESDPVVKNKLGDKLQLDCIVIASRYDDLKWLNQTGNELGLADDKDHVCIRNITIIRNVYHNIASLKFKNTNLETAGYYTCRALEVETKTYIKKTVRVVVVENDFALWIIILIAVVVILQICLIIGCLIYWRVRKTRRRNGNDFNLGGLPNSDMPTLHDFIKDLPYDKAFEFSESKLKIGKCLGYGNFGMVSEAIAKKIIKGEDRSLVAVKTIKDARNTEALRCLISEMKIMIHLGKHVNVVNLLGAVTKNLSQGELMVIVEYCAYGNLEMFLRSHRNVFMNQIDPISDEVDQSIMNHMLEGEIAAPSSTDNYVPMDKFTLPKSSISYTKKGVGNNYSPAPAMNMLPASKNKDFKKPLLSTEESLKMRYEVLTTTDLISWACQIARGMAYISSRNIMHGDLASRNILLASNNTVKICDFGLAKSISCNYGEYTKTSSVKLPLKWLALESLQDNVFTIKSDIWSYGVLLWELFSLGRTPYAGVSARGFEFLQMLRNGYRMEKPEYANQKLYDLMLNCWKASPAERPKFHESEAFLSKMMPHDIYMHCVEINEPYEQANTEYFKNRTDYQGDYETMLKLPQDIENRYLNNAPLYVNTKGRRLEEQQ